MRYPEQLPIRMAADTRRKLKSRADREGRTESAMARLIIERALLKEKAK